MAGASHAVKWLGRQWRRVQLARELLDEYEYEQEHRLSYAEAMRRMEEAGLFTHAATPVGADKWRAAIKARAGRYPSG